MPEVRVLGSDEAAVLERVAEGVFDDAVDARWTAEFFADPRHHLAVALEIVEVFPVPGGPTGFELIIWNEMGINTTYRAQRRRVHLANQS